MTLAVFTLLGKTKIYAITTVNGVFVFTTDMTKSLQSVGFSPLKSQLEVRNSFFFLIKCRFSLLLASVPNLSQTVTKSNDKGVDLFAINRLSLRFLWSNYDIRFSQVCFGRSASLERIWGYSKTHTSQEEWRHSGSCGGAWLIPRTWQFGEARVEEHPRVSCTFAPLVSGNSGKRPRRPLQPSLF